MGLGRMLWRGTKVGRTVDTVRNIIDEGSVVDGVKRTFKEDFCEDNPLISWIYSEGKYEGKKEGYVEASSIYKTKLLKQADKFLAQTKIFEKEREKYEELLDEYEKEIELLMTKENKSEGEVEYLQKLLLKERELKKISDNIVADDAMEEANAELFLMGVDDVFPITGRGIVVTGTIAEGEVEPGEKLILKKLSGEEIEVTVAGIEMSRKLLDYATAGDSVGILLKGVTEKDVQKGTLLINDSSVYESRCKLKDISENEKKSTHMVIDYGMYEVPGYGTTVIGTVSGNGCICVNDKVIVRTRFGDEFESTVLEINFGGNPKNQLSMASKDDIKYGMLLSGVFFDEVQYGDYIIKVDDSNDIGDDVDVDFLMPIDDVFTITGRGIVLTGTVAEGEIHVCDKAVVVKKSGEKQEVTVSGIEMHRKLLDMATKGDTIGILIRGITQNEVGKGDSIIIYTK